VSLGYQYGKVMSWLITRFWLSKQSRFDAVTAISEQIREIYNPYLHNSITTIYNGCNVDFIQGDTEPVFTHKINDLKKRYSAVLGTYAYVTKRKGLQQVLDVLVELKDFAFVIIGEGPELQNLKNFCVRKNLLDRVLFVPYQRKPYCYLDFIDVFMMTSYSEGFGLSMVEAALLNKAIVCSDIPSFNEIFDKDEAAFFTLNDRVSLTQAILKAHENKIIMGSKACKKALDKFTAAKMARNYLEFYKVQMKMLR